MDKFSHGHDFGALDQARSYQETTKQLNSIVMIRSSLWAYSAVAVLDDIEVCSNSQGGGGGGGIL